MVPSNYGRGNVRAGNYPHRDDHSKALSSQIGALVTTVGTQKERVDTLRNESKEMMNLLNRKITASEKRMQTDESLLAAFAFTTEQQELIQSIQDENTPIGERGKLIRRLKKQIQTDYKDNAINQRVAAGGNHDLENVDDSGDAKMSDRPVDMPVPTPTAPADNDSDMPDTAVPMPIPPVPKSVPEDNDPDMSPTPKSKTPRAKPLSEFVNETVDPTGKPSHNPNGWTVNEPVSKPKQKKKGGRYGPGYNPAQTVSSEEALPDELNKKPAAKRGPEMSIVGGVPKVASVDAGPDTNISITSDALVPAPQNIVPYVQNVQNKRSTIDADTNPRTNKRQGIEVPPPPPPPPPRSPSPPPLPVEVPTGFEGITGSEGNIKRRATQGNRPAVEQAVGRPVRFYDAETWSDLNPKYKSE